MASRRDHLPSDTRYSCKLAVELAAESPFLGRLYQTIQAIGSRAKKNGVEFDLYTRGVQDGSLEKAARRVYSMMEANDFRCPCLGIKYDITPRDGRSGGQNYSPSIDRIDPTKGYTWDNVWVISYKANSVKRDATERELYDVADAVYRERIQREIGDKDDDTCIRHRGGRSTTGADNNLATDNSGAEQ